MKLEFSRQIFENFSSSIGTATLVGYGLLNYRWIFLAGKILQSAVCQRHFKPPTWRTSDVEGSNSLDHVSLTSERRERTPAAEGGTMG